jgi:hypothetical protein
MNDPTDTLPADVPPAIDAEFQPVAVSAVVVEPPLPDLAPDETGYLLNGQYYAAVRFARGAGADRHMFAVTCMAFARDQLGKPYLNADGLPLEGVGTASCEKAELVADAGRADAVRQAAVDLAARELLALIAENVAFEQLRM